MLDKKIDRRQSKTVAARTGFGLLFQTMQRLRSLIVECASTIPTALLVGVAAVETAISDTGEHNVGYIISWP